MRKLYYDDYINEKYRATCKEWILLIEKQLGRLLTPDEMQEIYEIIKKDFINLKESD